MHSIIPAITLNGIIAYDIVKGPVDTQQFIKFLKEHVVCSWEIFIGFIDK